jgi:hypothetical protein
LGSRTIGGSCVISDRASRSSCPLMLAVPHRWEIGPASGSMRDLRVYCDPVVHPGDPGAAHAARSVSCRSARRVTAPPSISTVMRAASSSAVRRKASSIFSLISAGRTRCWMWIRLVMPLMPRRRRTHFLPARAGLGGNSTKLTLVNAPSNCRVLIERKCETIPDSARFPSMITHDRREEKP